MIIENTVFEDLKKREIKLAKENILNRYNTPEYDSQGKEDVLERYCTPEYFDLSDIEEFEDILATEISPIETVMLLEHFSKKPDDNFFVARKGALVTRWLYQQRGKKIPGYILEELEKQLKNNVNLFSEEEYKEALEELTFIEES